MSCRAARPRATRCKLVAAAPSLVDLRVGGAAAPSSESPSPGNEKCLPDLALVRVDVSRLRRLPRLRKLPFLASKPCRRDDAPRKSLRPRRGLMLSSSSAVPPSPPRRRERRLPVPAVTLRLRLGARPRGDLLLDPGPGLLSCPDVPLSLPRLAPALAVTLRRRCCRPLRRPPSRRGLFPSARSLPGDASSSTSSDFLSACFSSNAARTRPPFRSI